MEANPQQEAYNRLKPLAERLEEIKKTRAELDQLETETKELVMKEMKTNGWDSVKTELSTIYIQRRKKWAYSQAVEIAEKAAKEKLKSLKAKEEDEGIATCEETESLAFRTVNQ